MQITVELLKKWPMLSGQVSCMSLVTNNNIIIRYANSHKRAECQYQRDRFNNTNLFKHGPGLSKDFFYSCETHIKRSYQTRRFKKCLHGMTQIQKESYNALIWERAPKKCVFMRFAVYDAVPVFNDSRQGSFKLLINVGINHGYYTTELCSILNTRRRIRASQKWQNDTKKHRKILRSQKKEEVACHKTKVRKVL